jgi:hypothetical protein
MCEVGGRSGLVGAPKLLAEILEQLGRTEEAYKWHAQALQHPHVVKRRAYSLPELAATAVVTTAIVPFLQALTAKVAEDAYGQARRMVRRLLRRNGRDNDRNAESSQRTAPSTGAEPGLAILQDPDAGITLFLWSNASDEALRALSSLDFRELTLRRPDQGQVHLVWHPASGTWHIRGS